MASTNHPLHDGVHPYQLLVLAVLCAVALGLMVAMAMVVQGQVEKAQSFYAQKESVPAAASVSVAQLTKRGT